MRADANAYLGQVKTRAVTSIIVVPVHVKDLLSLDGEQAREDTLGQTSAQDDDLGCESAGAEMRGVDGTHIVFFIHGFVTRKGWWGGWWWWWLVRRNERRRPL